MAALSAENKYILNRYFGSAGNKSKLGDLMEDAMATSSSDIADDAVTTAKILDANVTTAKIVDDAITAAKMAASSVVDASFDVSQLVLDYTTQAVIFSGSGALGAPAVTDNAVNVMTTNWHHLYWTNINQQDLGCAYVAGSGINIAGDQTDNDGMEINMGSTASPVQKTVDTDNFYFRAKLLVEDASGTDLFYVGLRKVEAHSNTGASIDTFVSGGWNINAATPAVRIISDKGGAASVDTDTTDTIGDAEYLDVKIWQGDEARLLSAIELMAGVKAAVDAHYLDFGATGEEHIAEPTALAVAAPTTVATLIAAVTEVMASYAAHEADAQLGAAWVYHQADNTHDDSLASDVPPTTLAECVTKLNDVRLKVDLHVADDAAHSAGDSGVVTAGIPQAANTHILLGINGALAVPTVAVAFNFTAADVVIPYVHMTQHGDLTGYLYLQNWEVVDVTTV